MKKNILFFGVLFILPKFNDKISIGDAMNLYFFLIIILTLIGAKFFVKKYNYDYLSKKNTSCIKGIFILIVFYSHLVTYTYSIYNKDFIMLNFRNFLGQLMVTMFLFYSGYGVFESIKKKNQNYINLMPKKRILKTWFNFFIAVLSFCILGFIFNNHFSFGKIILSFIGWETLGNSNWYIFSIMFMYLLTYFSFKIFDDNHKKALFLNFILIIIFILFLRLHKGEYWYNTIFCYYFGMLYSHCKDSIEIILFNNLKYIFSLVLSIFVFLIFMVYSKYNFIFYELYSISFVCIIILITMKVQINSIILKWFGDNLFWIYILQRIPMIVFKEVGLSNYVYKYSFVVFVSTIALTFIYKFFISKIEKVLF